MNGFNISVLFILIFSLQSLFAQQKKVDKADELMKRFNYSAALPKYLDANKHQTSLYHTTIQIANCYRLTGQKEKAVEWYKKAIEFPNFEKNNLFYLGQMLTQLDQTSEAHDYLKRYYESPGVCHFQLTKDYNTLLNHLQQDRQQVVIGKLPINSSYSEMGPICFGKEFYFSSNRPAKMFIKRLDVRNKLPFYDIYKCDLAMVHKPELANKAFNTVYNDGPLSFSPDGNMAFITRNSSIKGNEKESGIFVASFEMGEFSEQASPLPINDKDYSIIHPCMSIDGKRLWFASNKSGGLGGFDIYYSDLKGGFWSEPVNAGDLINSIGNDVFPFISQDGTLFFASDGHPGLGGLDIFYALPDAENGFTLPFNFGTPLNSPFDDFGICFQNGSSNGFFVSNREGGIGDDDIYSFEIINPIRYTKIVIDIVSTDKIPLTEVAVAVIDDNSKLFNELSSDNNGHLSLYIPSFESFTLSIKKRLYQNREIILQPSMLKDKQLKLEVEMQKK